MSLRVIKRNIVGAFIFSKDNKLLLGKTIKGGVYTDNWVVPGGGVEDGETEYAALTREIKEEIGIDASNSEIEKMKGILTGRSEKILRDTGEKVEVEMIFHDFRVTLDGDSDSVSLTLDDDFTEANWFEIQQLEALELSPSTLARLRMMNIL